MSDDIPFNKKLDLAPDTVDEPMPGCAASWRTIPGPFTFKGTISYIIGRGNVAIVDPGPDDERHIGALLDAVSDETVTRDLRHPHPPRPFAGGAGGQGGDRRHRLCRRPAPRRAAAAHRRAQPARFQRRPRLPSRRRLKDGEVVSGDGWTIEAVTTPGHTANHMAYASRNRTCCSPATT